ncbi:MAG: Hsp20/alpha crystallin family protein [Gemmatimonadetes bacterium]|nr:Hsp20/alpha crystallin family protein [Gemmatimonadota bacterium]
MTDEAQKKGTVDDLLADVEAYIDDWFQAKLPFTFQGGVRWTPPTDVYETEDDYRVTMAIPGMRTEDIEVHFERDTLRVRGVRRERQGDPRNYFKMEIPVGPFERRIRLPRSIQADEITVHYENGLLRITVPKVSRVDVSIESA